MTDSTVNQLHKKSESRTNEFQ